MQDSVSVNPWILFHNTEPPISTLHHNAMRMEIKIENVSVICVTLVYWALSAVFAAGRCCSVLLQRIVVNCINILPKQPTNYSQ